jgi:hypothetical protein
MLPASMSWQLIGKVQQLGEHFEVWRQLASLLAPAGIDCSIGWLGESKRD